MAAVGIMAAAHTLLLDGLGGAVCSLLGEDTVYAAGYTGSGFRRVHRGDTPTQVLEKLGEPMERFGMKKDVSADDGWLYRLPDSNAEGWSFSRSQHSDNYRIRVVVFLEGKVVDKVAKFYVD